MTMNVAGAFAVAFCLTVTSSQQKDSVVSFTTETADAAEYTATFEMNELNLVTLYNNPQEAAENAAEETDIQEEYISDTEAVSTEVSENPEETEVKNRWGIELTTEEIDLLAKIVWVEARGESETGQKAVVEVVFNRMISEDFPDQLYDVLSQKNPTQFSSWKHRDSAKPTEKEYASIYAVLEGETSVIREDTVYFATKKLTSNLDIKIGGHYFCY